MNLSILLAVMVASVLVPALAGAADDRAAPSAASSPVFHAGDLVPASHLRGPDYSLDDRVTVMDDRYLFTLRTSTGLLTAQGSQMLQVRIDEMRALERARALDRQPQEMEGVKESFKQTGEGVKGLLTDPGHTLGNIPKGINRKFGSLTHKDPGGGDTRRQFAAAIECDPETDNPELKKLLDKLALRRNIGKGAVGVAGFFATAGAANLAMVMKGAGAMRATAEINETLRTTPLYKINEQIRDDLAGLGVPQADRESFIEQRNLTTLQRLLFMQQYRRIWQVPGSPLLVHMALDRRDRAESLAFIRTIELLAQLHAQAPLAAIRVSHEPIAKLIDGSEIYVSGADYLSERSPVPVDVAALRARNPSGSLTILLSGRAGPAARNSFVRSRVPLVEQGDVTALAARLR